MDEIAIRVEGLGKSYRLHHEKDGRYRTLREDLLNLPRRLVAAVRRRDEEIFWALSDVSFDVKRGEMLGVIGRNGAGKSTLLKILSRVTRPTTGTADVYGRLGSLLEVGTGFHPELTGRENVFLSGALLGMPRAEIRRRFDEIVDFSGVEQFIDTPCKHYSSGMYTRLGFAVASHLDADVLLVDEVLAVGDAKFRERCQVKMTDVVHSSGKVVILVSHEAALVRSLCSRVLLLESGRLVMSGTPGEVLQAYQRGPSESGTSIVGEIERLHPGVVIERMKVAGSEVIPIMLPADAPRLDVEITGRLEFEARMALEVRLLDSEGGVIAFFSPGHLTGRIARFSKGPFKVQECIRLPRLLNGTYFLWISLTDPNRQCWCDLRRTIRLNAEGTATQLGILTTGANSGAMLLDEVPTDGPTQ